MNTRPPLGDRLARWLVRRLPAQFRYDFRATIEADLDERVRDDDQRGLVRHEVPSLARAVVREHVTSFFSMLREDVRYAFRMMRRTPGFTATAVVMLALGTGVNAALFSVIDAVMLRTPFSHPEQIVILRVTSHRGTTAAVPVDRFAQLAAAPGPFSAVAGLRGGPHIVTGTGEPRSIDVECVSSAMFDVLGARPQLGRVFSADEDRPGADPVMVLSFAFWQRLGGSPAIVGSTLTVNQTAMHVAGVMPSGFAGAFSRSDTDAWVPLQRPIVGGGLAGCSLASSYNVFARLRDGMTIESAQGSLDGIRLTSIDDQTFEDVRQSFVVLAGAVAFVLLIACFNVAGLQIERTLARKREMALRLALGASRGRLVRQALTENVVLALAGALVGLVATVLTLKTLISILPSNMPHIDQIAVNARVLVATLIAASAAGIVAGVLPIGQLRQVRPAGDLTSGARVNERHGSWTRRGLVVLEIALSVAVMIGAALMIQTFVTLRFTNVGFDADRRLSLPVRLPGATPDASARFVADVLDRLRETPGIRTLAASTYQPMRGTRFEAPVAFGAVTKDINIVAITPDYFALLNIPLQAGRQFDVSDRLGSEPVVIVNDTLARRIHPDGRVLGEMIGVTPITHVRDPPAGRRIVGVVASTRAVGSDTRAWDEVYVPYAQESAATMFFFAETNPGAEAAVGTALRTVVRTTRPDLVVEDVESMPEVLDRSVRWWRFGAWLLGVFAALAIVLAAIGVMTTIGWWVNQRTREIGVRVALGASRRAVSGLVLRQGLTIGVVGVACGCVLAAWATRYLQSWIHGVTPVDPATFIVCSVGMLFVAVLAIALPVRRATSVDPVVALRAE